MKLIDPHQCGSPELCKVRLLDLENAVQVFIKRMSAGTTAFMSGYYYSPNSGKRIAQVVDIEVKTPFDTLVGERWYVCFKAELYWYFGQIYKHKDWGMGASVPLKMLMEAKYGRPNSGKRDAKIAVMHDIDVCYGMRASEWLKWAYENHTNDENQKPDKSAGVALKFMKRVF